MSYGTLASDVIQSSTTGTPPQFNDGSGTQIGTLCRAWVNFNPSSGSSAVIRASFNVSSVTYNATGDYTVNITNALVDANYSWVLGVSKASLTSGNNPTAYANESFAPTTSALRVMSNYVQTPQNQINPLYFTVGIFR
jgi:hypothetical protein